MDECVGKLEKLADLGINIPIAFDLIGPDPEIGVELIAKEIEPRLVRRKKAESSSLSIGGQTIP